LSLGALGGVASDQQQAPPGPGEEGVEGVQADVGEVAHQRVERLKAHDEASVD